MITGFVFVMMLLTEYLNVLPLGMSTARMVVEPHGGGIWGERELGKGTRAFFALSKIFKP